MSEDISAEKERIGIPDDNSSNSVSGSGTAIQTGTETLAITLNTHFQSFIALRSALDKYQKENHVQLIVKDSKLLSAESTRRVIPKVYHLVNQSLMYHSITYCCKCHGALKQKPGSRIKNVGAKRLNCPMYLRFKLSSDFQSLVLFDLLESHNHSTDPNTFQMSPRQQIYRLSRMKRGNSDPVVVEREESEKKESSSLDSVQDLIATAIKDVNSISSLSDNEPPAKKSCSVHSHPDTESETFHLKEGEETEKDKASSHKEPAPHGEEEEDEDEDVIFFEDNPNSPLDPDSSCSDSDEEEFRNQRHLLPYPIRLIGAAVQCSPELLSLAKDLIETQKENLLMAKKKLLLETKLLELKNTKLSLEVKNLEKTLSTSPDQTTTFYLHS